MRTTPPYLDRQNRNTPPFGSKGFLGKTPPSSQELKRISPRGSPRVQDCFDSYMQVGVRQGRGASRISPSVDSRETLRNSPSQSQSSTEIQRSSGHARGGVQIRHSPMEHSDNLGMLRNQVS